MKYLLKLILIINCMLSLTACDTKPNDDKLIVGIVADNPPFEFIQETQLIGFEIDFINEIANKLNKTVIFKNLELNQLFTALENGNIDLAIAGLSVTQQRKVKFAFSNVYLTTPVAILHRISDPINSINDLSNKTLGYQLGSVWENVIDELRVNINIKPQSLTNNLMLVEALKAKSVDAAIIEEAQAKRFTTNNTDLNYFIIDPIYNQQFAIAFRNNSKLLPLINSTIKQLEEEGKMKIIMQKWLIP